MQNCCLCNRIIKQSCKEQMPLYTKFGQLCIDCISKGHYEKLQLIKNREEFERYKLSLLGL